MPDQDVGAIYALLSRVFLKETDAALLHELARDEIAQIGESLAPGFRARIAPPHDDEARLEEEATEYARLFLLPGGVSPYAAGWMAGEEGAIRADLEERISNLYEVLRLRPADFGLGNVPSDHVGMLLALTAAAYGIEPSGDLANRCRALLKPWGATFGETLATTTESPLYRAAGRLLVILLDDDAA